jgi:hypothetical protein
MGIKVKAMEPGYYGAQRRRPGDVFEIQNENERGSWMGAVDDIVAEKTNKAPFTSEIKGTAAGGNIFSPPGGKPAWEEPASELNIKAPEPKKAPEAAKSKRRMAKSKK